MLSLLMLVWLGLLVALISFAIGRPRAGGALALGYFLGLSLIHVPGILPFFTSVSFAAFSQGFADREATELGFRTTIAGMTAFLIGAVLARMLGGHPASGEIHAFPQRSRAFERAGWQGIAVGAFGYFVL